MRVLCMWGCLILLFAAAAFSQQPAAPPKPAEKEPAKPAASAELTNLLDARIKAEWEAIKNKDKKAYGELLDDDFIGVLADGSGERFKWQVLRDLDISVVADYSLSFLKVTPLCPDAVFLRYESFIKFPPKSLVKFEKILVGEIWVRRNGQWKELHYQETRVK
jgi:hypothetical protein